MEPTTTEATETKPEQPKPARGPDAKKAAASAPATTTDKSEKAPTKAPPLGQLFAPILAEFQAGNPRSLQPGTPSLGNQLSPRAAALLCGHLIHEVGLEEAACMTRPEARAWADGFSKRYPAAWGAIVKQDLLRFVRVLSAFGVSTLDEKGYQSKAEDLLRP